MPELVQQLTGIHVSDKFDSLVTVLIMIIAIYAVSGIYSRLFPSKKPEHLEHDYGRLLLVAGDYINLRPDFIDTKIKKLFSKSQRPFVEKAGLDFFKPAREEGVAITASDGNQISSQAVAESPSDLDLLADDVIDQYPLPNVEIEVRASDKDHNKSGWAAVVKSVTQRRLKMLVYPTINPEALFGEETITGDVIVVCKRDNTGDYKPYMYHLVRLSNEDSKHKTSVAPRKVKSSHHRKKPQDN